jgi:hypothetical protein
MSTTCCAKQIYAAAFLAEKSAGDGAATMVELILW